MEDNRPQEELEFHISPEEKQEQTAELILTPSPVDKQPNSDELILEADVISKVKEITFDGETEAEDRIKEAMKAYDAAMDEAAGVK